MIKITTPQQLMDAFSEEVIEDARVNLQHHGFDDYEPFGWHVREQCRMDSGEYKQIKIAGDDVARFLHVSLGSPNKVAYTNDERDGERDVQRTTTLPRYCEKFGLDYDEYEKQNAPTKNESTTALVKRYIAALNEVRLLEAELLTIF